MNKDFKLPTPEETNKIVKERLGYRKYQYYLRYKWKYNPGGRCRLPGAIVTQVNNDYGKEFASEKLKSCYKSGVKAICWILLSWPVVAGLAYLLKEIIWAIWCLFQLAAIPFLYIFDSDLCDLLEADKVGAFKGFMVIYTLICLAMILRIVFQEEFIDGATQYTTKIKRNE